MNSNMLRFTMYGRTCYATHFFKKQTPFQKARYFCSGYGFDVLRTHFQNLQKEIDLIRSDEIDLIRSDMDYPSRKRTVNNNWRTVQIQYEIDAKLTEMENCYKFSKTAYLFIDALHSQFRNLRKELDMLKFDVDFVILSRNGEHFKRIAEIHYDIDCKLAEMKKLHDNIQNAEMKRINGILINSFLGMFCIMASIGLGGAALQFFLH